MEREQNKRELGFKAAVQFAMAAARSTSNVPIEVLEDAVQYGEHLLKPGVSLDDALEIEGALKALRSLVLYRKLLEGAPQVFEVLDAIDADTTGMGATVTVGGAELGTIAPGQRVLITITYDPTNYDDKENGDSADTAAGPEQDHGAGDAGPGEEGPDGA